MPKERIAIAPKLLSFGLAAGVVLMDQLTKQLALMHLTLHQPKPIFSFFNLTLAYNSGAAFNFLSSSGHWARVFLVVVSLLVSVGIAISLCRLDKPTWYLRFGLASMLGGALGNLVDRLHYGYVVDFIQVYYHQFYWPTFNCADAALCLGVVLIIRK